MDDNKSFTSYNIKIIAIITMLIDHVGAIVLEDYLGSGGTSRLISTVDIVMRCIGRIAFPLFIFMLIEGFKHTRSRGKYLLRLTTFALISDVPFTMGFDHKDFGDIYPYIWTHANVFYTLALGLIGMILFERISNNYPVEAIEGSWAARMSPGLRGVIRTIGIAGTTVVLMYIAYWLDCDYNKFGVLAILVGYILRGNALSQMVGIVLVLMLQNPIEACAFVDIYVVVNYNCELGKKLNRWVFYIFYPAHLIFLVLVRELLLG